MTVIGNDGTDFVFQSNFTAMGNRIEKPDFPVAICIGEPFQHGQDRSQPDPSADQYNGPVGMGVQVKAAIGRNDIDHVSFLNAVMEETR